MSLLTVAVVALLGLQQAQIATQSVPPGYVALDGSKTPFAIPDWTAWGTAFRILDLASADDSSPSYEALGLSPEERKLVVDTAKQQGTLDSECQRQ